MNKTASKMKKMLILIIAIFSVLVSINKVSLAGKRPTYNGFEPIETTIYNEKGEEKKYEFRLPNGWKSVGYDVGMPDGSLGHGNIVYWIRYNRETFFNYTSDDLKALSTLENIETSVDLWCYLDGIKEPGKHSHKSNSSNYFLCLKHNESDRGSGNDYKIGNVIDINMDGNKSIKIYKDGREVYSKIYSSEDENEIKVWKTANGLAKAMAEYNNLTHDDISSGGINNVNEEQNVNGKNHRHYQLNRTIIYLGQQLTANKELNKYINKDFKGELNGIDLNEGNGSIGNTVTECLNTSGNYKARILVMCSAGQVFQQQFIFAGEECPPQKGKLQIQKKDENGKDIKKAGIIFNVSQDGKDVATLSTNKDGYAEIELETGKYKITEKFLTTIPSPRYYQYEKNNIGKEWTVEIKPNETTNKDVDGNGFINESNLADLTIEKTGAENKALSGIQFYIKRQGDETLYIKILDKNGSKIDTITGNVTIDKDIHLSPSKNVWLSNTGYGIQYVEKESQATKFITDSNGKIVIKNLEKFYGRKDSEKFTYTAEEILNTGYGYKKISISGNTVKLADNNTMKIKNIQYLKNFTISKLGESSASLSGVEFKIKIIRGNVVKYLKLNEVASDKKVTGTVTINKNNKTTTGEYTVSYVNNESEATIFVTNSMGKITIKNLEAYYKDGDDGSCKYQAIETWNPNYGYKGNKVESEQIDITDKQSVNVQNTMEKGNLQIHKVNEDDTNINISGMQFKIKVDTGDNNNQYIKISGITGNKATGTVNCSGHTITYVPKSQATIFETNSSGIINVQNLEVYKSYGIKYTYTVEEVGESSYYGAIGSSSGKLEKNKTKYVTNTGFSDTNTAKFTNKQLYVDISGYVWMDEWAPNGKDVIRNNLRDTNEKGINGITVTLKDSDGKVVATTKTAANASLYKDIKNGIYKFDKVEIAKLDSYYIEYEYDGILYQATALKKTSSNGSKASEVSRDELDKKATSVSNSGNASQNVKIGNSTVKYNSINNGESSVIEILQEKTNSYERNNRSDYSKILANTKASGYKLKTDTGFKYGNTTISNINLGIYKKKQADLALHQDLATVKVGINGYNHVYNYSTTPSAYTESASWNVGVEFENKFREGQYNRVIYKSDVVYEDTNKSNELQVYLTYKVALSASTYDSKVNTIRYYFDNKYNLVSVGRKVNTTNNTVEDVINTSNLKVTEMNNGYNYIDINVNSEIGAEKASYIYLQFYLSKENISKVLGNQDESISVHAKAEITSYTVYKDKNKNTLAVVDKNSVPGNYNINNSNRTDENDSDEAKTLKLKLSEIRSFTGTVFEDNTTVSDNRRNGNGILDNGERGISGVKVELCNTNGEIAKVYDDGKSAWINAETITDSNGNYTFKNYIPGKYIVKFTWGDSNHSVYDYKGTIYVDNTRQSNQLWYLDTNRKYSDAIDNWETRQAIDNSTKELTKEKLEKLDKNIKITSTTPVMDIKVERQTNNFSSGIDAVKFEVQNVDFGIAERARQQLLLEKNIAAFKITTSLGATIVDAKVENGKLVGSTDHMMYIKDHMIKAEMSDELIQGSTLEVTYALNLRNNSETDYITENYYKYGIIGNESQKVKIMPAGIVDYINYNLGFDATKNSHWSKVEQTDISNKLGIAKEYTMITKDKQDLKTKNIVYNTDEVIKQLSSGETASTSIVTSKLLTTSDDTTFDNYAEVVKVTTNGGRPLTTFPAGIAENASVLPSTGENKDIAIYIIGAICLIVLSSGIVIIKKKVLNKN